MNETPRFTKVTDTPYGPHLRRVRGANEDTPVASKKRPWLRNTIAAGMLATIPSDTARLPEVDDAVNPLEPVVEATETPTFDAERYEPIFERSYETELSGYEAYTRLGVNEVLFVNEQNEPVGEPMALVDYIDEPPERVRERRPDITEYLYTPGDPDELGLPNGIAPDWLNYVQAKVQAEYPEQPIANRYNVLQTFRAALRNEDEPELIAAVQNEEITQYEEVVRYFAEKPVVGAEEFTRAEYLREAVVFDGSLPPVVQSELRRLLPGLAAQESKFDNGVKSRDGAKGILQFMPDTWEELGWEPSDIISLRNQVEAAGEHFSNIYKRVQHFVGDEAWGVLRGWFDSDEAFERELVVSLMINAYNAGSRRVGEAAKAFVEAHPHILDAPDNKSTFLAIAEYAKKRTDGVFALYGEDAREYVSRVEAHVQLFTED